MSRWTNSRLLSRKWRLCLAVCATAITLDAIGRPLPFEYATAISGIATTLIGMQTWLDTRRPDKGHWTPERTLSRKWWTGSILIIGLFGAAAAGVVLASSTLTLVGTVMGAWLGGQTYLDYKAGGVV